MKAIELLPTDFKLPATLPGTLGGEESIIFGRPFKKIPTKLSVLRTTVQPPAHDPRPVSIWVEEGRSDGLVALLAQLNLLS